MKKLVLIVSITLLLVSCSKRIYYEYYSNGKYAAFEIKNNYVAIYRSNGNTYIRTKSTAVFSTTDSTSYIGFSLPYSMFYLDEHQEKFDLCGFNHKTSEDKYRLLTYKKINEDSIVSIGKSDRNQFLEIGSCYTENNINWLPPYLKKVKKIDYKKFNLPQVKDKYLKNPVKAPKVYE